MTRMRHACVLFVLSGCASNVQNVAHTTLPPMVDDAAGALPPTAIEPNLRQSAQASAANCYFAADAVVPLHGRVEFRIVTKQALGNVATPIRSDIGNRKVENCMASVVKAAIATEKNDSLLAFEFVATGASASVAVIAPEQLTEKVNSQRHTLERCGLDGMQMDVTAWIAPGGDVLSAGLAAPTPRAPVGWQDNCGAKATCDMVKWQKYDAALDCVADAVTKWKLTNGTKRIAKAQFSLK